jgi:hypothetical protein
LRYAVGRILGTNPDGSAVTGYINSFRVPANLACFFLRAVSEKP